jgi:hypothetical protein
MRIFLKLNINLRANLRTKRKLLTFGSAGVCGLLINFPNSTLASSLSCFQPNSGVMASVSYQAAPLAEIRFRFSANRGYEFIQQIEGPISARDIPMVQWQINNLKELGSGFELKFPGTVCDLKRRAEGIFQCFQDVTIANTQLKASSLTGFTVHQSHVSGDFDLQNFRMLIGTTDVFFFSVSFPKSSCVGSL